MQGDAFKHEEPADSREEKKKKQKKSFEKRPVDS